MPTSVYQQIDIKNTLYDNVVITADGNSSTIDFGLVAGCPDSELLIKTKDMEGTGTIDFVLQDDFATPGTLADTPFMIRLPALGNGTYAINLTNNMIKGQKFRIRHDITAGTDGDGIQISAHLRPRRP